MKNPGLSMSLNDKRQFLSECPILRDVPKEELTRLATFMRFVSYPPHTQLDDTRKNPRPPLRAVVSGRIESITLAAGNQHRRLVGPGEFSGGESVEAFAEGKRGRGQHWFSYVVDRSWVLELSPADFGSALGRNEKDPSALQRLRQAFLLDVWWPVMFPTLRGTSLFRRLRPDIAWSMLSRGTFRKTQEDEFLFGEPGDTPEVPNGFVILLKGNLGVTALPHGSLVDFLAKEQIVPSGTMLGFQHLVDERPMDLTVRAKGTPLIFELGVDEFVIATHTVPGLAKRLYDLLPPNNSTIGGSIVPSAIVTPFINHCQRSTVPMSDWILDVQRDLMEGMNEPTIVLQLMPGTFGPKQTEQIVEVGADDFLGILKRLSIAKTRHVLIDTSRLGQGVDAFVAELPNLVQTEPGDPKSSFPVRPLVLVDHAPDWPELAARLPLPARRWSLPVAVLPTPPRPGKADSVNRVMSGAIDGSPAPLTTPASPRPRSRRTRGLPGSIPPPRGRTPRGDAPRAPVACGARSSP